jgi:hypothetical protein
VVRAQGSHTGPVRVVCAEVVTYACDTRHIRSLTGCLIHLPMRSGWYNFYPMRALVIVALSLCLVGMQPALALACQSSIFGGCDTAANRPCCKHMSMDGAGIQISSPAMQCCIARAPIPAAKYITSNPAVTVAPAIARGTLTETPIIRRAPQRSPVAEAPSPPSPPSQSSLCTFLI